MAAARQGSAAALLAQSGNGFAILLSPHPESSQAGGDNRKTPGRERLRRIVQRCVECVSQLPEAKSEVVG
jgi:hypothetical protein